MAKSQIAVLHIPHSSRRVPAEERQAIRLDDEALNSELLSHDGRRAHQKVPK
jgi:hypothetical protein